MFQALLGLYFLFSLLTMFSLKTPVQVALISYLPVVMVMAHFLVSVVGLREFTAAHGLKMTRADVVRMAFAWIPYQLVLAYAAGRAVVRQMRGINNWEKTAHVGAHRGPASESAETFKEIIDDAA